MDATSPAAGRIAGDHSDFSPGVRKLLGTLVARFALWLGLEGATRPHRDSDQAPSHVLPA